MAPSSRLAEFNCNGCYGPGGVPRPINGILVATTFVQVVRSGLVAFCRSLLCFGGPLRSIQSVHSSLRALLPPSGANRCHRCWRCISCVHTFGVLCLRFGPVHLLPPLLPRYLMKSKIALTIVYILVSGLASSTMAAETVEVPRFKTVDEAIGWVKAKGTCKDLCMPSENRPPRRRRLKKDQMESYGHGLPRLIFNTSRKWVAIEAFGLQLFDLGLPSCRLKTLQRGYVRLSRRNMLFNKMESCPKFRSVLQLKMLKVKRYWNFWFPPRAISTAMG